MVITQNSTRYFTFGTAVLKPFEILPKTCAVVGVTIQLIPVEVAISFVGLFFVNSTGTTRPRGSKMYIGLLQTNLPIVWRIDRDDQLI